MRWRGKCCVKGYLVSKRKGQTVIDSRVVTMFLTEKVMGDEGR